MDNENGVEEKKMTVRDYIFGCVNFQVPDEAVDYILSQREEEVKGDDLLSGTDKRIRELLKADLYVWICMGPTKVDSTSDSDNGWKHSDGGYTLTDADKDRMLAYARSIYEKYDEEAFDDSVEVHVSSFGIQPCNYDEAGFPLPHIE